MVVARTTTLTAMALLALFAVANAQKCGADTYGTVTANSVQLNDVTLNIGVRDFDITLPDACTTGHPVGSTVTACDYDVAPVVTHSDVLHAHVHRMGDLTQLGVVHSVLYCS